MRQSTSLILKETQKALCCLFSVYTSICVLFPELQDQRSILWDRSLTLVRGGGLMQKIFIVKIFRAPFQTAKKFRAPFLPWKLRVNPIEKHVNSIFNGKSVVIFFRAPLTRVKNFKGPFFASDPPLQVFVNGPYCNTFVLPVIPPWGILDATGVFSLDVEIEM